MSKKIFVVVILGLLMVLVSSLSYAAKININTADSTELQKLPTIGPALAQKIIDYRETHGPFEKIEDIKKVKGIGTIKFNRIKNQITVREDQ